MDFLKYDKRRIWTCFMDTDQFGIMALGHRCGALINSAMPQVLKYNKPSKNP